MLADCLFARSRLVYLARPEFPEASLLLEPTMQRLLGAVSITPEGRTAQRVADAVDEALERPAPHHEERLDGVAVAVKRLRELLE
jgi:predicted glycosyltransferase